jgi:hypothetical protein
MKSNGEWRYRFTNNVYFYIYVYGTVSNFCLPPKWLLSTRFDRIVYNFPTCSTCGPWPASFIPHHFFVMFNDTHASSNSIPLAIFELRNMWRKHKGLKLFALVWFALVSEPINVLLSAVSYLWKTPSTLASRNYCATWSQIYEDLNDIYSQISFFKLHGKIVQYDLRLLCFLVLDSCLQTIGRTFRSGIANRKASVCRRLTRTQRIQNSHKMSGPQRHSNLRSWHSSGRGHYKQKNKQTPWPLVRERTIPTERPPLVDEI